MNVWFFYNKNEVKQSTDYGYSQMKNEYKPTKLYIKPKSSDMIGAVGKL
jgi:hypothetical protein